MRNRLVWVFLIGLSLVVTKTHAQVSFGVRAGLNLSTWQGDATESFRGILDLTNGAVDAKIREGFHAGIYTNIPLGKRFAIEPGIQYSQKGVRMYGSYSAATLEFINVKAEVTNKAHYIDVPIVAKAYLAEGFHVFAGPQVSYLIDNKMHVRASALGLSLLNRDIDMNNGFQKIDIALVGGLGYTFDNGFNIRASYDHGLRRIDNKDNFDVYNRALKLSLGYHF